jgi:hypothetical protein
VNSIKKDYSDLKQASVKDETISQFEVPYIAVGCVGWSGIERRIIQHGGGDNRQLVAVFENLDEIKAHLASLREEEWKFTKKHIDRPKVFEKIRRAMEREAGEGSTVKRENQTGETTPQVDSQQSEASGSENTLSAMTFSSTDMERHQRGGPTRGWSVIRRLLGTGICRSV